MMPAAKYVISSRRGRLLSTKFARKTLGGKIKLLPNPKSGKSCKRKRSRTNTLENVIQGIRIKLRRTDLSPKEREALEKRINTLEKRLRPFERF